MAMFVGGAVGAGGSRITTSKKSNGFKIEIVHLTSLPKRGVGALLSVSAYNHKRAPMYVYSYSLPSKSLKYWTNNNVQWSRRPWKLKF